MFTSAKKHYKIGLVLSLLVLLSFGFIFAKREYQDNDFGKEFNNRLLVANSNMEKLQPGFELCSQLTSVSPKFLSAIVFPEIMRYNKLKDDVESESLKVLYVQFGDQYADFSIGKFQMKPSFVEKLEKLVDSLLPDSLSKELNLSYSSSAADSVREERVKRLLDVDWQQVYLTAFVLVCDQLYKDAEFDKELDKMQFYSAIYNGGFDKDKNWIDERIEKGESYLENGMPGKKFNYNALATYYFKKVDN